MDMVERAARAMCQAAKMNPDALVFPGQPTTLMVGGRVCYMLPNIRPVPVWTLRIDEVKAVLALGQDPAPTDPAPAGQAPNEPAPAEPPVSDPDPTPTPDPAQDGAATA